MGEEGVVGAEEDAFGSDESGYGLEDGGAVEEGGSGGVEVDIFHAFKNLRHEGVEGEAATPVGRRRFCCGGSFG